MNLQWDEIYERIKKLPKDALYWGVPRGGAIVAGLTGSAVKDINQCDYIIDDIIDSGHTMKLFKESHPHKRFIALVDKQKEKITEWVKFPWEGDDVKDSVVNVLNYVGENPRRDGLIDTPSRVIKSWDHLYGGYKLDPIQILGKTFENEKRYDQMVVLKDIEFYSTCEHHMLPFFGKAKIAYIPKDRIVGISKLARVLEVFSRRLQVQERLTNEIAHAIQDALKPIGVGVILEAKHMCMVIRGVQKQNSIMTTSCLLGAMKEEGQTRQEFLSL